MSEHPHPLQQVKVPTQKIDKKVVREAILRLRQLAADLPPTDAATILRAIREATLRAGT